VADVQGFIESSKFELDGGSARATAQLLGDAQTVFLVLLAIAHYEGVLPASSRGAMLRLPRNGSAALEALAERLRRGGDMPAVHPDDTRATAGRDITTDRSPEDDPDHGIHVLYREFVVAVNRVVGDGRRASRV
jgi:hypothetical protein